MIQLFEKDGEVPGVFIDDKFVYIFDPTFLRKGSLPTRPTSNIRYKTFLPSQQRFDKQPELYTVEILYTIDIFLLYKTVRRSHR